MTIYTHGRPVKYTIDEINEKIKDRGIVLIRQYKNTQTKAIFQCRLLHEWNARPNDILVGGGCPVCSNRTKLSRKIINKKISPDRKITMIGEYINGTTKTEFKCSKDHIWSARPDAVVGGTGCPYCSKRPPLSTSIINDRLKDRSIILVDNYVNARTKHNFKCNNNHIWKATAASVLAGNGCPKCSNYGFNPNKHAWKYIFVRDNYIKYGITNDLKRRLIEHKRHGNFSLIYEKYCEDGKEAIIWENNIKSIYGGNYANKEQCPDGYTETLPINLAKILTNN